MILQLLDGIGYQNDNSKRSMCEYNRYIILQWYVKQ